MICKECGGERVVWVGPLSGSHTECLDCGAWNSHWSKVMEDFFQDEDLFEGGRSPGDE